MITTNPPVVTAHATQNQPSIPPQPSSTLPLRIDSIPGGMSSNATWGNQSQPVQRTISNSGPRLRPGCTRYQWPSSMASLTAPKKAAPTTVRASDSQAGSPPANPAATTPMSPMSGAMRSSPGGNSAAVVSRSTAARSMPVMAATRAERCSASASWPATPAARRCTDTHSATPAAMATPTDDRSRTQLVSTRTKPMPAAMRAKMP